MRVAWLLEVNSRFSAIKHEPVSRMGSAAAVIKSRCRCTSTLRCSELFPLRWRIAKLHHYEGFSLWHSDRLPLRPCSTGHRQQFLMSGSIMRWNDKWRGNTKMGQEMKWRGRDAFSRRPGSESETASSNSFLCLGKDICPARSGHTEPRLANLIVPDKVSAWCDGQGSFVSKILSCKGDNSVSLNDTSGERNVGVPPSIYFNI